MSALEDPPDDPKRFPAGRGVTLTYDDLVAARSSINAGYTYQSSTPDNFDARLALARGSLGEKAEGLRVEAPTPGIAFVAVGPKDSLGPFSCNELVIPERGAPLIRRTDNKRCGLPYHLIPDMVFTGKAPRVTSTRLKSVQAEIASMGSSASSTKEMIATARLKLGLPDRTTADEAEWMGIGGRGDQAPITCHVLRINTASGVVRVDQRDLSRCGLSWPVEDMTFDAGPDFPAVSIEPAIRECNLRCGPKEMCVVDRKISAYASLVSSNGGMLKAAYMDGRPAKIELSSSCTAIPATCNPVNASCWFPPAPPPPPPGTLATPYQPWNNNGPCPRETYAGFSFTTSPIPHITCMSRIGGPPRPSAPPPLLPSSPTLPSAKPAPPKAPPPPNRGTTGLDRQILM